MDETRLDKIEIKELEVFANHGVYPEENVLGQKFVISATLFTRTRLAGLTDELSASINYGEVSHMITDFTRKHTYKLLESLAENLAEMLLCSLSGLEKITLKIEKPWAPVGLPLKTVSVEITRKWHTAYIAFGSNMGDKKMYIDNGIRGLAETKGCRIEAISDYLITEPYGVTDQDEFLNGVLKMRTLLTPEELLVRLHQLEQAANRERIIHWGPRTLDLDILFYDQEIIEMTAGTTGYTPEFIQKNEEMMTSSFLYDLVNQMYMYAQADEEAPKDKIYEAESKVVKELAEKGNCVIVGRCSDYVLRDNRNCLRVFFSAPMENRMKRVMERRHLSEKDARQKIQKEDKWRADNYRYYTGRIWGAAGNFDLTVNTALGEDYIEMCIREAMKR